LEQKQCRILEKKLHSSLDNLHEILVSNSAFLWVKLQTDICWSVLFDLFIEKQMQCQKKIFVAQPHFVKKATAKRVAFSKRF